MNSTRELMNTGEGLSDFTCPTCGKACPNPGIDATCTRCGAVLGDAVRVRQTALNLFAKGVQALPDAPPQAIVHLESAYRLQPDAVCARRLACAYLLNQNYPEAWRWRQCALQWQTA